MFKNLRVQALFFGLCLITILLNSEIFASQSEEGPHNVRQFIKPAQAFFKNNSLVTPGDGEPIPFGHGIFVENLKIQNDNSTFIIKVPGRYEIDSLFTITNGIVGEIYTPAVLINGQSYLNFQFPVEAFLDNFQTGANASLFLKKGDEINIVLLNSPIGTTIGKRSLAIINSSQTK